MANGLSLSHEGWVFCLGGVGGVGVALPNLKCSLVVLRKKKNAKCQNAKVEAS